MSLFKNWKLILAASTVALFTACAGSSGGSSDEDYSDDSDSPSAQRSAPKEKIDENKLFTIPTPMTQERLEEILFEYGLMENIENDYRI